MRFFLILTVLFVGKYSNAQLLSESGNLFADVSTIISDMPGNTGDDYHNPTASELNTFGNTLSLLLQHNYTQSADSAGTIGYSLTEYSDTETNQTYYLLQSTDSNYWGTYIYNPNYCRPLVIQSPHPKKDFNTGKEGIHVFLETNALFFMLSGTSRCNSSAYTTCSGSTSVCSGSSENYRISDLAHILNTPFQLTTDSLFHHFVDSYFLQLHGFGRDPGEPYIILSNGTNITPVTDYILPLEANLQLEDPFFDDSIMVAHVDLTWTELRGFGNVQGRLINSSSDACLNNATATNGRFIHMEQEKSRLREDSSGWTKVSNALINTFPCTLGIEPIHSSANKKRIGITDLLGRQTEIKPNTVLIYIYSDGTTEKVIVVAD